MPDAVEKQRVEEVREAIDNLFLDIGGQKKYGVESDDNKASPAEGK